MRRFFLFVLAAFFVTPGTFALPLGANKVRYHTNQKWKILETRHFEIHYPQEWEKLADQAAVYAEEAFLKVSRRFNAVPRKKIPLFLFGTPMEFQETNITPSLLPEGVGGFTEAFKNRVVVPFTGYPEELRSVILHEVVHAFQYNFLYGESWRSLNLWKSVFVPTWLMEGSAEWIAEDWNLQGEMVLRDAAANDRLISFSVMDSFDHLENVFLAYKQSQSFLEFLSDVYGEEKVNALIRKMISPGVQPSAVVEKVLGVPMQKLDEKWAFYLKSRVFERLAGRPEPEAYGEAVLPDVSKAVVSPFGTRLALLQGNGLFLWDIEKRRKRRLAKGRFQTQGSGVAWSPDEKRLAYSIRKGAGYGLEVLDLENGRKIFRRFENLPVVFSPVFTPDGQGVVFTAYGEEGADLYLWNLNDKAPVRLTRSPLLESYAQFREGVLYYLVSDGAAWGIHRAVFDTAGDLKEEPLATPQLGTLTSLLVREGRLWVTADRDGRIANVFSMDLQGEDLRQHTKSGRDFLALSGAPTAAGPFLALIYQKEMLTLWRLSPEKFENAEASAPNLAFLSASFEDAGRLTGLWNTPADALELPQPTPDTQGAAGAPPAPSAVEVQDASNLVHLTWEIPPERADAVIRFRIYRSEIEEGRPPVEKLLASTLSGRSRSFTDYDVVPGKRYRYRVAAVGAHDQEVFGPSVEAAPVLAMQKRDYAFHVTPDLLFFLAGYDSSFGFAGFGLMSLSDDLGDHRLSFVGNAVPGLQNGFQTSYGWYAKRASFELSAYRLQDFLQFVDLQTGEITDKFRSNESGAFLNMTYPFSTTFRAEVGLGTQRLEGVPSFLQLSESLNNLFNGEGPERNIANIYRLSLVQERRKGERFWAAGGFAWNLTYLQAVEFAGSNRRFRNLLGELQWYVPLPGRSLIWANRLQGFSTFGRDPQTPFAAKDAPFRSYPTVLRGFGGDVFAGNRLALWNAELRWPLAQRLDFPLSPLSFLLVKDIELAVFSDTLAVGDHLMEWSVKGLKNSIGAGLRIYQLVYQRALMQLRLDVAWRTDRSAPPFYHFNLVPIF